MTSCPEESECDISTTSADLSLPSASDLYCFDALLLKQTCHCRPLKRSRPVFSCSQTNARVAKRPKTAATKSVASAKPVQKDTSICSSNLLSVMNNLCCLIELLVRWRTCRMSSWQPNSMSNRRSGDEQHRNETSTISPTPINKNNNNSRKSISKVIKSSCRSLFSALSSLFKMCPTLLSLILLISFVLRITEACSSRSTPKPRPPSPTTRPNITFQTYACPEAYAKWYCLNGATCFSVRIGESILYNCECADGYMGQRCEFKDLDGSYLPSREKVLVETASIAGGATVAVLLMVFITIFYYTYVRQRKKDKRILNFDLTYDQVERKHVNVTGLLSEFQSKHPLYHSYSPTTYLQDLECGGRLMTSLRPAMLTPNNNQRNQMKHCFNNNEPT